MLKKQERRGDCGPLGPNLVPHKCTFKDTDCTVITTAAHISGAVPLQNEQKHPSAIQGRLGLHRTKKAQPAPAAPGGDMLPIFRLTQEL